MLRTITVGSPTGVKEYRSEATTWGQFKDSLKGNFNDIDKMRAVVRETRIDLVSDGAVLPEESFTLLLTVKQIKAGGKDVDVIKVLEQVKKKFCESIDEVIEGILEGDFDKAIFTTAKASKPISSDLQRELEALKNGSF